MFIPDERTDYLNNPIVLGVLDRLVERGWTPSVRPAPPDRAADLLLSMVVDGRVHDYRVEVKTRPTTATPAVLGPASEGLLLLAEHITPAVSAAARDVGLNFADTYGNMYLTGPGLLVDIQGRRIPDPVHRSPREPRAFRTSGLQLILVLLDDLRAVDLPYRDLAQLSRTSLGSVQWVLSELQEQGFVEATGRHRRLHRTRELFDRWTESYLRTLAPKSDLGRYATDDLDAWTRGHVPVETHDCQWSGEVAAMLREAPLRPSSATIYCDTLPTKLMATYRLRKDPQGSVAVRRRFFQPIPGSREVPSTLIHADLLTTREPRQLEAATWLRTHDEQLRSIDRG